MWYYYLLEMCIVDKSLSRKKVIIVSPWMSIISETINWRWVVTIVAIYISVQWPCNFPCSILSSPEIFTILFKCNIPSPKNPKKIYEQNTNKKFSRYESYLILLHRHPEQILKYWENWEIGKWYAKKPKITQHNLKQLKITQKYQK